MSSRNRPGAEGTKSSSTPYEAVHHVRSIRRACASLMPVARASRGRRRRARERVRGMSEGAKRPSESAGEGVAVTGVRVSRGRIHARSTDLYERIGWGGCGGNWCPGVARSSRSQPHEYRIQANRPERAWLKPVSGCRTVVSITRPLTRTRANRPGGRDRNACPRVVWPWMSRRSLPISAATTERRAVDRRVLPRRERRSESVGERPPDGDDGRPCEC